MFKLSKVRKYDEELLTILFDVTNKIEIRKIRIKLYHDWLSNEDMKNICAKIKEKIRGFETQNIIFKDVSYFV